VDWDLVLNLLQSGKVTKPHFRDNICVYGARAYGHYKVMEWFLNFKFLNPRDECIWSDLIFGCCRQVMRDQWEIVQLLLSDPRVDPGYKGNAAILYESWLGHSKSVALLLADPRCDPTARDNWSIENASKQCHITTVELLWKDPRVQKISFQKGFTVKDGKYVSLSE
jgi:hypothetical protein